MSHTSGVVDVVPVTTPAIPPPPSGYGQTVLADDPSATGASATPSSTSAIDQRAINPGVFATAPTPGAPSLLAAEAGNKQSRFDGVDDHVARADSGSLTIAAPITLEAWIKPTSLPAAGSFVSIVTKAASYALQLNGPLLELTVMQFGVRQRLQAPAGDDRRRAAPTTSSAPTTAPRSASTSTAVEVANAPLTGARPTTTNGLLSAPGTAAGVLHRHDRRGRRLRQGADREPGRQRTTRWRRLGAAASAGRRADRTSAATAVSSSQIDLSWTDNAGNETE